MHCGITCFTMLKLYGIVSILEIGKSETTDPTCSTGFTVCLKRIFYDEAKCILYI